MKKLGFIQKLRQCVATIFYLTSFASAWAGVNDGLVAFYPLDGNSNDGTANGLDMTEFGTFQYGTDRFGNSGRAALFQGASYLKGATEDQIFGNDNPEEYTISYWVKSEGGHSKTMVSFYESDPGYGDDQFLFSSLVIDNNKIWTLARTPGSETLLIPVSTTEAFVGKWIHLTTTFNKSEGTMKTYVDGQLSQEGVIDPLSDYSDNGSFFIGANQYGTMVGHFEGLIDDVRIYNRALTGVEVSDLHAEEYPITDGFPFGGLTWKAYEDGTPWRELSDHEFGHDETTVWLQSPTDVASHMIHSHESFSEQNMTWEAEMWLVGNFNWQSFPFNIKSPFCRIFYYNYSGQWYVDTFDASGARVEHILTLPQPTAGTHYFWKCSYDTSTSEAVVFYRSEGSSYQEVFRGPTDWGGEMRLSDGQLHPSTHFNLRMNDGVGKTYYQFALLEGNPNYCNNDAYAIYQLDGNGIDSGCHQRDGTVYNALPTEDRFGTSESALFFDGSGDYVDIGHIGLANGLYTVSGWYYLTEEPVNVWRAIFSENSGAFGKGILVTQLRKALGLKLRFQIKDDAGTYYIADSTSSIHANTWNHFAAVRTTNSIQLYINGILETEIPVTSWTGVLNTGSAKIGRQTDGESDDFLGKIDGIQIYQRDLSAEEIIDMMNATDCTTTLPQGLVVHYPLDGNGNDVAVNQLNGVVHNAIPAMDRFGNPSGAMYFDGDGDYIQIENHSSLNNHPQMTMSAWVKTSASYDWAGHIVAKGSDYNYQYGMIVNREGWARGFAWYSGGAVHLSAQSDFLVNDDQWHHITTTLNHGNAAHLYVDGQLVATGSPTNWSWNMNGSAPLFLGGVINGYTVRGFYEGLMDDVRIYHRVLNACEIEALANDTGASCYNDDFSTDLAHWTPYGSWQIENGELVGNYSQDCGSPGCPQADLILNPEFQIDGDLKASVDFIRTKYRGSYNYHRAVANFSVWNQSNQRMSIQIGGGGDGDWGGQQDSLSVYTQSNNGNWQSYDFVNLPISWNTEVWNTASIIRQGNQYLIQFNGQTIHSFVDGFLNGQGDIGLHIYGTQRYDNFELCPWYESDENQAPTVACQDITIGLDSQGKATLTPSDLDNGSYDPDGDLITLSLSRELFDCSHIGIQEITMTATDPSGASNSCVALVNVVDSIPPIALAKDIVLTLNDQGTVSLLPAQVDNGSSDNCGIASYSISQTEFNCLNRGDSSVEFQLVDINGNSSTTLFNVTVIDTTAPILSCIDHIELTANAQCSATTPNMVISATDNCDQELIIVQSPSSDTILGLGVHTITTSATDHSGNTTTCISTVTVLDQSAPSLSCVTPAIVHANENCQGMIPVIDFTVDDNCDNSVVVTQSPEAGSFVPPGQYAVVLTAVDASGNSTQCGIQVTVIDSTAPEVVTVSGPSAPVEINTEISMIATAFDGCGIVSTEWIWGDGTSDTGYVIEETGEFVAFHTYTIPGVYTVDFIISDEAGNTSSQSFQYVVVYDPEGGFVTGGGWISSPTGAYVGEPNMTGKANFGFVAKYKKGANTPSGNTAFNFKAGNLKFKSTSYEWLVVAGANAKYKGVGSINGEDGYGFMLTATDGDLHGNNQTDTFRIKIWDALTDEIVYDNKMGTADDSNDGQSIGGGNVVIHP